MNKNHVEIVDTNVLKCKSPDFKIIYKNIPVLPNDISYDSFFHKFMVNHYPCIIENTTTNWNSSKFWVANGQPNISYLKEHYGKSQVTVYDCNIKYYNSHKAEKRCFANYLRYWDKCMNDETTLENQFYLKDWHLKNEYPEDNFYEVPIYFSSDWLNEFLIEKGRDDYRFVYMGPKGTWTAFHADVFMSYSWSTNVCGRKKWIFVPPSEESKLRDRLGNVPFDIREKLNDVTHYEVIQNPGDAIFVPSSWYHQVWNLDNTISINHNWVNSTNITRMWEALVENLRRVKKEIEDCKDMENYDDHCQVMLKASFGINMLVFYELLKYIALKRIRLIKENTCDVLYNNYVLGRNHAIYDATMIKLVLEMFVDHDDVSKIVFPDREDPGDFLKMITSFLASL